MIFEICQLNLNIFCSIFSFESLVLHLRLYLISFIYAGLLKTIKLFFIVSKYNINFFSFTNYTFFISHYSMIFEICQLNFNIFCSFESLVLHSSLYLIWFIYAWLLMMTVLGLQAETLCGEQLSMGILNGRLLRLTIQSN